MFCHELTPHNRLTNHVIHSPSQPPSPRLRRPHTTLACCSRTLALCSRPFRPTNSLQSEGVNGIIELYNAGKEAVLHVRISLSGLRAFERQCFQPTICIL
jgi:hypothetical protein